MSTRIDTASRLIRAPADVVFQAFADAGAMTAWLPPEGMTAEMLAFDFRPGGAYRMRLTYTDPQNAPGKTTEDADVVEVGIVGLVPGERIEQAVTFESDDPAFAGEMHMTWTFTLTPAGTQVTVRCEDVPPGIRQDDHLEGLRSTLDNLAAFVEAGG